jgi:hypothetical protein
MPDEAEALCLVEEFDIRIENSVDDGGVTEETGSGDISAW